MNKEEIIKLANDLHHAIYRLQNSGEVDELECSKLTMDADDLRESIFKFFDKQEAN